MKRLIITESERLNIKKMYGLITEDDKCKKCIGNYKGSLDKCGFYAIDRFEENYGSPSNKTMGNDYFETGVGDYTVKDNIINGRLNNYISKAWNSMDFKTKMQVWSFMYNSDSSDPDNFRWLAVLYLTAKEDYNEFDEDDTKQIIRNSGSSEWNKAVELVNNTENWDHNKLKNMLLGQYGTYTVPGWDSWSHRPDDLDRFYDDCISGVDPKSAITPKKTQTENGSVLITGKDDEEFKKNIKEKTKDISIDESSIKIDFVTKKLTFNYGDKIIKNLSFIFDPNSEQNLLTRIQGKDWISKQEGEKNLKEKNLPNKLRILKGPYEVNGLYYVLISIE